MVQRAVEVVQNTIALARIDFRLPAEPIEGSNCLHTRLVLVVEVVDVVRSARFLYFGIEPLLLELDMGSRQRVELPIRLGDVADVQVARGKKTQVAIQNGNPAMSLRVDRANGANVLGTLNLVKNAVDELRVGPLANAGLDFSLRKIPITCNSFPALIIDKIGVLR